VRLCWGVSQDAREAGFLSCICSDGTQCRQESAGGPDATRCSAWIQDNEGPQDAESMLRESGRNTTVSDAGHLFGDGVSTISSLICKDAITVQNVNAGSTIYSMWIILPKSQGGCEARLVRCIEQIW